MNSFEISTLLVGTAGGLALFLYGMRKMTESLKLVAGEHAKNVLGKLTSNRFTAALAGAGVTAVIQSSSITTVLVVGFITAGVMSFSQSIGIILGANVGTTITAQIIAFKIAESALVLIAAGFFTEVLAKNSRVRRLGIMFMGLGMLFFGMELMSQATEPLRSYEPFMDYMRTMDSPVMAILVGTILTALVQSSSATTAIVIVMSSQGFLTLETSIAIIMGANIGTCITVYVSAIGKPREAMQAAMAHVLFNVAGVFLFVAFIPALADLVRNISPVSSQLDQPSQLINDIPRQIANAHTIFNVLNLLVFLGFTNLLAKCVLRLVPAEPPQVIEIIEPKFIDPYYLDQPAMALDRVSMEIGRMGNHALDMVRDSMPVLTVGTRERIQSLKKRDDEVDILHSAIIVYLRKLSSGDLLGSQPARLYRYVMTANHFENVADIVKQGLVSDSFKRLDHQLMFSAGTEEIIKNIYKEAYLAGQQTLDAFGTNDIEKAKAVIESKGRFGGLIERARSHLYSRLTQESPEHLSVYKIESNAIENYRRIHHRLVSICELLINGSDVQSGDDVDQNSNPSMGQHDLSDGDSV